MDCVEMEPLLLNKRLIKSLVQNFSLLIDPTDSEKYLRYVKLAGYAIYQACKICQARCL